MTSLIEGYMVNPMNDPLVESAWSRNRWAAVENGFRTYGR